MRKIELANLKIFFRQWYLCHKHALKRVGKKILTILVMFTMLLYGFYLPIGVLGATYSFNQASWAGGATANEAVHSSNQSGWTEYSAKDSGLTAGTNLTLGTSASTTVVTNDGSTNTGFNISGASLSSTAVSGTGPSASVALSTSASLGWTTSTLDTTGTVGQYNSIAVAPDGFARISYYDTSNANLNYIQCTNASCSTKNTATLDSTGDVGKFSSIALGTDGYSRISYHDVTNQTLKFIQCTNDACTSKNTSTVDTVGTGAGGDIQSPTSLAMASDGYARIAYYEDVNDDLKFAQCTNDACSTNVLTSVVTNGTTGLAPSLVMGLDGYARITMNSLNDSAIAFIQCTNDTCSTKNTSFPISQSFRNTTLKIASDGFGRFVIYSGRFIKCTNASCSASNNQAASSGTFLIQSLILDSNGYGLMVGKDNTTGNVLFYQCTNANCSTGSQTTVDSSNNGGTGTIGIALDSTGAARTSYYHSTNGDLMYAYQYYPYNSSGTYTSGAMNIGVGVVSWGNLSWTAGGTGQIYMQVRSDADGDFSNATNFNSCDFLSNGASMSTNNCMTAGHQYIQYKVSFTTADTSVTPTIDDVTIGYNLYSTSATLTSSAYDSGDATNVIGTLAWDEDASLPSGTTVTVSLRTASASAGLTGAWTDFTNATANCSKTSGTVTCTSSAIPSGMKDGSGDRWFQYKTTLTSTGANTPAVDNINVQYVVNAPPSFDATFGTNGVSIAQVSDSASADWGKIQVQYKIRDTDTTTGSANPGYATPSFEYNIGGGWVAITSGYLASGDLNNKIVDNTTYNTYTATWDAKTQIPNTYYVSAQVRVTLNDNEGANNTATAASATFALDTKNPTITTFTIDSTADTLSLNLSDDANISYRLSNDSSFTGVDWTSAGAVSYVATPAWTFTGAPSNEVVYLQVRDLYSNSSSQTAVAPETPASIDIKDISNENTEVYREFISWSVFSATTSSAFTNYKVYRSTDGASYSLKTTITDSAINYYTDTSVATTSTYYYKVLFTDTNGDVSNYSSAVSDLPDGQGGTDTTAPTISGVSASTIQATWATITWTTDELANSVVNHSISPSTAFGTVTTDSSYVTSHSVTLSGLTPNTTYLYRVKSTDVLTNLATADNSGAGYSFTTLGGPTISDVTTKSVADQRAEVIWNTNSDSNSYVVYSASLSSLQSGSGSEVGSVSLVGTSTDGIYQHTVNLTGLSQSTKYYYYVKSTDASSNTVTDRNGGDYYTFTTTLDNKPPVISSVVVLVSTRNSAVIAWDTDEDATSQIEYGTSAGTYSTASTLDSTLSIKHAVTLTGLSNNTTYYYRAKSKDAQDNEGVSSELSFLTSDVNTVTITLPSEGGGGSGGIEQDSTPPKISNVKVDNIEAFNTNVSFDTDEPTTAYISFGETDKYGKISAEPEFKTHHSVNLFGLKLGTSYHFQAKAQDKQGNFGNSSDGTFQTKFVSEALEELVTLENAEQFQSQLEGIIASTLPSLIPPVISNIEVSNITDNSATIKWSTNVPAFGVAAYTGENAYDDKKLDVYGSEISQTESKSRTHSLDVTGLSPGELYHFQIKSFSLPGVIGKSKDGVFVTKASVVKPEITKIGNTDFEIRWFTEAETSSFVEFKNIATGKIGRVGDSDKIKTHSVKVEDLMPGSTYEVRVFGYDSNNTIVEGNLLNIKTKKDTVPPVISSIKIDNALLSGRSDRLQTVVSWLTDEPANSVVYYEEGVGSPGEELANKASDEKSYRTEHIIIITSLKPSTIYRIKLASSDESGNIATTSVRTILTPKSAESVLDVILKNFEESFGFLKNL